VSRVLSVLFFSWVLLAGCAVDPGGLPAPDGSVATTCSNDEECSDGVDCTDDVCAAGVCSFVEVDSRCADGEVCLAGRGCQAPSECVPADCEGSLRSDFICEIGVCDGENCRGESTCEAGESCCGDGTCMACDDGNPCTEDSCDAAAGGCVHTPLDGTPCDDGDFCTGTEVCVAGLCESSGDPCVAPTFCEVDRCVGCLNDGDCPADIEPPFGSCEYTSTCDQRARRRRTVTSFACVAEECVGTDSEETDGCSRNTNGDSCGDGTVLGPWSVCGGYDDTCDNTGTRSAERTTYTCGGGTCGDAVTTDTENCTRNTDGSACMDGDACTISDQCSGGSCAGGGTRDCDDSNPCTDDSCNPSSGCVYSNNTNSCDDGDACTISDQCSDGSCAGGGSRDCDDSNPCTDDSCNPSSGCVYSNNTSSCDDGISCTGEGTCSDGMCTNGSSTCVGGGSGDCGACTGGTSCTCDVETDACACMM